MKTFHNEKKLKQFTPTKPTWQNIPKRILHTEEDDKHNHKNYGEELILLDK
jgi:hypothetical protein